MPLHDFLCECCGITLEDQYRSLAEGGMHTAPLCPRCSTQMVWIPQVGAMDAFEPGQEFIVYDGQNNPRKIESFAQMRQLERESAQQYRNGEGQPLRFRALHQHRSNMDDNTFGDVPQEKPTEAGKRKFGLGRAATPVRGEPDRAFGPAVNETNCSALKE